MEKFKVEIWKKEGLDFKYTALKQTEIREIINSIEIKFNISINDANISFFTHILGGLNKELVLLNINESNGFKDLISLLDLKLSENSKVNIVWNNDEVDQFKLGVLLNNWDYIWYGVSDEICLLQFIDVQLFVAITDYGTVYL